MKKSVVLTVTALAGVAVVIALGLPAVRPTAAGTGSADGKTSDGLVARGKYLVNFGGCNDCHSPKIMTDRGPVPDPKRLLSGHPETEKLPAFDKQLVTTSGWVLFTPDLTAAVGPWGVTCAYNLTPDENTGIGLWTEKMFIGALRTGKHMGAGRAIMPPMPWMNMNELTDEDLSAIYAYLMSIPPVKNAVPPPLTLDEYMSVVK
jgi:mono/diheme cytochrome c family protein